MLSLGATVGLSPYALSSDTVNMKRMQCISVYFSVDKVVFLWLLSCFYVTALDLCFNSRTCL